MYTLVSNDGGKESLDDSRNIRKGKWEQTDDDDSKREIRMNRMKEG